MRYKLTILEEYKICKSVVANHFHMAILCMLIPVLKYTQIL